ncbi:hypothetical protein A33Y_0221 [Candidatus Carsonella ruddii CS isolate Thao2000]|uniref:Uncharacterized protein n=1 Tax=Candidatus Carsonella ruddii CS isolate Thao2000 TaxID=1202537 RepID=J7H0K8_CARRU|nr:hypothetical protein [Candidatus Carsonella ruddii]AFP83855.1 hypothetical protein A33Y_0221 [Candidatus Carsonella ruddii CS isolate Thao2000]
MNFIFEYRYFYFLEKVFNYKEKKLFIELTSKSIIFIIEYKNWFFFLKKNNINNLNELTHTKINLFNTIIKNRLVKILIKEYDIFLKGKNIVLQLLKEYFPVILFFNIIKKYLVIKLNFLKEIFFFNYLKIKSTEIENKILDFIFFKKYFFLINYNEFNIFIKIKFIKKKKKKFFFKLAEEIFFFFNFYKKLLISNSDNLNFFFNNKYNHVESYATAKISLKSFSTNYYYLILKLFLNFKLLKNDIIKIIIKRNFLYFYIVDKLKKELLLKKKIFFKKILTKIFFISMSSLNILKKYKNDFFFFFNRKNFLIILNYNSDNFNESIITTFSTLTL